MRRRLLSIDTVNFVLGKYDNSGDIRHTWITYSQRRGPLKTQLVLTEA